MREGALGPPGRSELGDHGDQAGGATGALGAPKVLLQDAFSGDLAGAVQIGEEVRFHVFSRSIQGEPRALCDQLNHLHLHLRTE